MKSDSIFSAEKIHIWGCVYGVPVLIGIPSILFGGDGVKALGALLIVGVIGSFLTISAIEAFHNWLERR